MCCSTGVVLVDGYPGFCHRSRIALQNDWQARQSNLDPRRRHPARPFPTHDVLGHAGALSADGKAVALQHKVISPSIDATMNPDVRQDQARRDHARRNQRAEVRNPEPQHALRPCRYSHSAHLLAVGNEFDTGVLPTSVSWTKWPIKLVRTRWRSGWRC